MCHMKKRANLVQICCEKEGLKKSKVYPQLLKLHKKSATRGLSHIKQNPADFTNKSHPLTLLKQPVQEKYENFCSKCL